MRTLKLFGAICTLLMATSQTTLSQANRNLSNLQSPTAVNQHLLPGTNNARDVGSNIRRWRNLFVSNREGINVNPAYPLDIFNNSNSRTINVLNPRTGEQIDRFGVYSSSIITDWYGYGVYGEGGYVGVEGIGAGGATTNGVFGVYGNANGTAGSRYGVYGVAGGGSFNAAGYFGGDVWAVTYNTISDRKVKTNIAPLKNSLEQLMKLKPAAYEFKTADYQNWGLLKGKQIGLIADEVKQVFPELVKEAVHPAEYGKDKTVVLHREEKYEGVNYIGLIPVLIASIQEQQKTIEAMKDENEELRTQLAEIKQMLAVTNPSKMPDAAVSLSSARLAQNAPNPFNRKTVINYYLPPNAGNALITITDMNGKIIKAVKIITKGDGQLTINAGELASGSYQYALTIGGRLIDSKKMVLTK